MGNSGRQAATGRRLAALQQRISSVGASNVRTGKLIENYNDEAGEDTPAETPRDSFPPFPTPKIRRARLSKKETDASPNPPPSKNTVTPLIGVNPWSKFRDLAAEASSQPHTDRDDQGGPNKECNISGDDGGTRIALVTDGTPATSPISHPTTHMLEGLDKSASQGEEQKHAPHNGGASDRPRGYGVQTSRAQIPPHPELRARSARGEDLDVMSKLGLESGINHVRVSKSIRMRKRDVASKFEHRHEKMTTSESASPYENCDKQPPAEAEPVPRRSSNVHRAEMCTRGMHHETALEDVGRRKVTAAATASPESSRHANPSHIPAPSLSFKTKKQRRRFDAKLIEAQLGIEFSPQHAERLRALSGDDMGAAINLYLQGCCSASESQTPVISNQKDEQDPGRSERQISSGPVSPMDFWQQLRQTEKQAPILGPEGAKELSGQGHALPEDQNLISEKSEQGCAEKRRGTSIHDVAEDTCLLKHDSGQLVHGRLASEQLEPQIQHQHGDYNGSGSTTMGDGVVDDPGDLGHTVDSAIYTDLKVTEANYKGENSGTGPVPLRSMQAFTNQENVRPRNPPSSTSRLPNGKLGTSLPTIQRLRSRAEEGLT
jgi:hypothetical protein